MSKKKSNTSNNMSARIELSEQQPFSYWILLGLLIWYLFYAPFNTGLFNGYQSSFDGPIYFAALLSSIILAFISIQLFMRYERFELHHVIGLIIFVLPLNYWVSSFQAASPQLAKNGLYIHMMYAFLFLAGLYLSSKQTSLRVITATITISGYAMVLFGIANMFGNMYSRDAVMLTDQGYRLTSDFQYANTYAAFLMIVLLCCLYYITNTTKRYWIVLHSLMLVPICLSFWLTLSRGGLLTLPFIFLLILPLLSFSRQLAYFIYSGLGIIAVIPIATGLSKRSTNLVQKVWNSMDNTAPFPDKTVKTISWFNLESLTGWSIVLFVAILVAVVTYLLQFYVLPLVEKRWSQVSSPKSRLLIPGVIIVMIAVGAITIFTGIKSIFPTPIKEQLDRINFQQHSFLERATIYKDSLKVIKDYPIFGTGSGGWASIYEKYQSNPYIARQAHNFLLQYAVEIGLIGLTVVLLLILLVLVLYVHNYYKTKIDSPHIIFYFIVITLCIHSLLDFDFSYVYIGSLIFLSLGCLASTINLQPKWIGKIESNRYFRWGYPTLLSLLALFMFISSIIMYSANKSFAAANNSLVTQQPLQKIMKELDSAIDKQPQNPEYLIKKADILMQLFLQSKDESYYNQSVQMLNDIREYEPNNRVAMDLSIQAYLRKNNIIEAITLNNEAVSRYPWEINYYNQLASLLLQAWDEARVASKSNEMDMYGSKLQKLYETVANKTEELAFLPKGQLQGRPFSITPAISLYFGQYHYLSGNPAKAVEILEKPAKAATLEGDEQTVSTQKNIVRWYLAALQMIGREDQDLRARLLSKWPEESNEISKLLH